MSSLKQVPSSEDKDTLLSFRRLWRDIFEVGMIDSVE
jgi:hypothetical protein